MEQETNQTSFINDCNHYEITAFYCVISVM